MFKNPLKYQQGGKTQNALGQLVKWLVQNTGLDENQISQRLNQILSDDTAKQELVNNLQNMQNGDQNAAQNIIGMFTPQSAKFGGKIHDFICKHARGGQVAGCGCEKPVLKGQEAIPGGMPRFQVVRDTTYTNPANRRIMEQIIVDPNGQAYRRTTENGINPIIIGGYWDGQFTPEGDDTIPVQRFDSLFRRAIPKQKSQNNQNIVKDQNPAGPMPNSSYFGTISSDPTTNPIRRWIDSKVNNNPTLRNIQTGFRNFGNSAMGKVLGFFMPDPNSESGMLGAAAPIGKIKYIPEGVQSPYKWMPSREYIEDAINRGTEMDDLLFALKRDPKLGTNPAQMFGKEGHASRIKLNPTREEVENFVQKIYNKYSR